MRKIIITTIFILLSIASTCFAVNPLLLPDKNPLLPVDTNRWKLFYINTKQMILQYMPIQKITPIFTKFCMTLAEWQICGSGAYTFRLIHQIYLKTPIL